MSSASDAPPPTSAVALNLDDAASAPSFADYMERCLFDPDWGYYSSGKVVFGEGEGKHFWTYPQRLSPLFGQMLAETARDAFAAMRDSGQLDDGPLTILELGAGNGDLARDTLDHIVAHANTPRWQGLAERIRYVIGERSASLRERQNDRLGGHVPAGRAEVRDVDAIQLNWIGPFQGMVVANELIDAFPCERLRVYAPDDVRRVHVVPVVERAFASTTALAPALCDPPAPVAALMKNGECGLSAAGMWLRLSDPSLARVPLRLIELQVPLSLGWWGDDDTSNEVPTALNDYLATLGPMIEDLAGLDELPVDLCWGPGVVPFTRQLSALLSGHERRGFALLIDYGGTSRHVLDPNAAAPHLRVYTGDDDEAHRDLVYEAAGARDITWDVDFTEVARLAQVAGLQAPFFGHQSILEGPNVDLWSRESQKHLIRGRVREGITDAMRALTTSHELIARFREAGGFRALLLSSPGLPLPERFSNSDPLDGEGLWTLSADFNTRDCLVAFAMAGVPPDLAARLKPGGDPIADFSDARCYAHRAAALEALRANGWLVPPGALA